MGLFFPLLSLPQLAHLLADHALMTSELPQCSWNAVQDNYL
jgi:hypothetical protein